SNADEAQRAISEMNGTVVNGVKFRLGMSESKPKAAAPMAPAAGFGGYYPGYPPQMSGYGMYAGYPGYGGYPQYGECWLVDSRICKRRQNWLHISCRLTPATTA